MTDGNTHFSGLSPVTGVWVHRLKPVSSSDQIYSPVEAQNVLLNVRLVRFSSVQLSDDRINVCAAESRVSQVLQEARLVPGGVTSH